MLLPRFLNSVNLLFHFALWPLKLMFCRMPEILKEQLFIQPILKLRRKETVACGLQRTIHITDMTLESKVNVTILKSLLRLPSSTPLSFYKPMVFIFEILISYGVLITTKVSKYGMALVRNVKVKYIGKFQP